MAKETQEIQDIDVKDNEQVEYVKIDTVPQPDYGYGNGQQTLDYKVAVRNRPDESLLLIGA